MKNKAAFNFTLSPSKAKATAAWSIDYDYVSQLNKEEALWLRQFTGEFYGARKPTSPIHPDSYWKEIYSSNNSRNRDLMSVPFCKQVEDYLGLISGEPGGEDDE